MNQHIIRDRAHQRGLLACLTLSTFMVSLDIGIVNVVLPIISRQMNVSMTKVSIVVLAYILVSASFIPLFGRLRKRVGYKTLFMAGRILFVTGSLLCGLSPNIYLLIASRVIQALGTAITLAISSAMMSYYFPKDIQNRLFGTFWMGRSLPFILGPMLGGVIAHYVGWRFIFFINVPIGLVAIALAYRYIPSGDTENRKSLPIDIGGTTLIFFIFTGLIIARQVHKGGSPNWGLMLGCGVLSVISFLAFLFWERRCHHPIINLSLLRNTNFTIANIVSLLAELAVAGIFFILPFFLIDGCGYTPKNAGLLLGIPAVACACISPAVGKLADTCGNRVFAKIAFTTLFSALFVLLFSSTTSPIAYIIVGFTLFGAAQGTFLPTISTMVMSHAPESHEDESSTIFALMRKTGTISGILVFEIVFTLKLPEKAAVSQKSLHTIAISKSQLNISWHHTIFVALVLSLVCLFSLFKMPSPTPHTDAAEN